MSNETGQADELTYADRIPDMPAYRDMLENGLRKNTLVEGKWWLAGVGPSDAQVMLVTGVATKDETATEFRSGWDSRNRKPRMSPRNPKAFDLDKCLMAFRDLARQAGIDLAQCFCVPCVRYYPDDDKKLANKPSKRLLDLFFPLLKADIERVKPSIIVCADKQVYDLLVRTPGIKLTEVDVMGAWMMNTDLNARVYLTKKPAFTEKPEFRERFLYDFRNVAHEMRLLDGEKTRKLPVNMTVVRTADELRKLVCTLRDGNHRVLSVDCEWHGSHHVDGKLRSLQIAWSDTDAAYIRFMDDQLNYSMDVDYREAGRILSEWLDDKRVKYIGHHVSADLVWMHHVLGLEYYHKAIFDSEFALQACDESSELGLDVLALRYTDLGKYDLKLIIWKKRNSKLCDDGYGYIPDDIMIPYAIYDVITVFRAWPRIWKEMRRQKLCRYWNRILGPMVTDVFTYLCLTGIPIDRSKTDEMRELYNWARVEFGKEFAETIVKEADELLERMMEENGYSGMTAAVQELVKEGSLDKATSLMDSLGLLTDSHNRAVFQHYVEAPVFNVQSSDKLRRWLFDVKQYTPLKSTSLKDQGIPAMDWSKVLEMPEDKQRQFTPAADQATLETLAARNSDAVLNELLQYKKICTVCKSFLKEGEKDADGEVVKEQGLHKWIASDDAIHGQLSTTETGKKLY